MRLRVTSHPNRDGFVDLMKLVHGAEARRSSAIPNILDVLLAPLQVHLVTKKIDTGRL
jgi:hypothetical protein